MRARIAYMETVIVRNAYAQGIGPPHVRDLALPQRCAWSMAGIGLIGAAWAIA